MIDKPLAALPVAEAVQVRRMSMVAIILLLLDVGAKVNINFDITAKRVIIFSVRRGVF